MLVSVLNKEREDEYQFDKDREIDKVYHGKATPKRPSKTLYEITGLILFKAVEKGFQKKLTAAHHGPDIETLRELKSNIFMFSAAKTFQQTREMSEALVNESYQIRTFSQFKKVAGTIFDRYNKDWLEAEFNTAVSTSRSAAKWGEILRNKDERPLVRFSAVKDEHTCEICGSLNGLIAPVGNAVWSGKACIPQHFNCECVYMSLTHDDAKEFGGVWPDDKIEAAVAKSQVNKNPMFNFNAAVDKVIFRDTGKYKHPYFEVPKKYKELAETNFNLPIPY